MTIEEIEKKAIQIIADIGEIPEETIQPSSSIIGDIGIDSLAFFEIVQEIEEVFELEIDEEDFEGIKLVSDVVKYIEQALSKK